MIITDNETDIAGQDVTHNHKKRGQETNQIRTQVVGTHDRGLTTWSKCSPRNLFWEDKLLFKVDLHCRMFDTK